MLTQYGKVVALEGDAIRVEVIRQTACEACSVNTSCGVGLLGRLSPNKTINLKLENSCGAGLDQRVKIRAPADKILRASLLVYTLPLAFMLIFSIACRSLIGSDGELEIALCAISGLVLGFLCAGLLSRRYLRAGCGLVLEEVSGPDNSNDEK